MKHLIPVIAAVSVLALVGCTSTTERTTTTTSTTTSQRNASLDPTIDNTRSTNTMNLGPR